MPRRRPPQPEPATWIMAMGGIPLAVVLSAGVSIVSFWAVSSYRLDEHKSNLASTRAEFSAELTTLRNDFKTELASVKTKQDQTAPAVTAQIEKERVERERVREAFIQNSTKTTELLGQMNQRLAVSEVKQETLNKAVEATNSTLSKISEQLQKLNAPTSRR